MGLFKKLTAAPPPPPAAAPRGYTKRPGLLLRPFTKTGAAEDGSELTTSGYRLLGESSGTIVSGDSAQLKKAGITLVFTVAGVSYRADDLQRPAFAPGQRVQLRPDPAEKHDPNAVGVWSEDGQVQVGWIPKKQAAELSPIIRSGDDRAGLVTVEHRGADGRRWGINLLVGPPPVVEYLMGKIED